MAGLHGVTDLAMGGAHTLGLRQTDDLVAWGANQNGVLGLGIGVSQDARVATKVPKLSCSQVKLCHCRAAASETLHRHCINSRFASALCLPKHGSAQLRQLMCCCVLSSLLRFASV